MRDFEFDADIPPFRDAEMAEVWQHVLGLILARRGFSIILCRQTQNILQNVGPQKEFSITAFWDYLPFLDGYEGQLGQSEF
jgi:hypothetical protein